ncbi:Pre-mRNA-splicing factor sap61 [Coemansia sp. RSA 2603]|nr:Pre-mRNA-splicing factor sap61 [Coemansia sp. RSA 2603]
MENSIIEQQRQAFEDIERAEVAIVDMMQQNLSKHRYRLIREHKISELLDQVQSRSRLILELEKDQSGKRRREMESMAEHQLEEFHARLGEIQDYHRRNPDVIVHPPELEYAKYKANPEQVEQDQNARAAKRLKFADNEEPSFEDILDDSHHSENVQTYVGEDDNEKLDTMFSGDERLGRYVDLNEQHELYLNIKDADRLSYLEYLTQFDSFEKYPRALKRLPGYKSYVLSLDEYFKGFFARAKPLFDLSGALAEARQEFDDQWARQAVPGWEASDDSNSFVCTTCNRQFEKDTTYNAHMKSLKHQKAVKRASEQAGVSNASEQNHSLADGNCDIAWTETAIRTYARILAENIRDTRANIERRQALTEEERQQELEEEEPEFVNDDDDEDEQIYNPLNLPLGWDGKPIPFWLYKLHGLGVKFSCEICGNAIYRGRKAYEKHFVETRHATNMRRLGIPNTRQFHGIASINEAQGLWERIQQENKKEIANADTFEEYEDSEGNVFNKKTYMDLKRQGLI